MTIDELIAALEEARTELGGGREVLIEGGAVWLVNDGTATFALAAQPGVPLTRPLRRLS